MMKKLKIVLFMTILLVAIAILGKVEASSISASPASISVTEGEKISFTIKANNATGEVFLKSSDSSIASVSGNSKWIEDNSVTITITAKRAGTATIKVYSTKTEGTSSVANSSDGSSVDVSTNCTITVKTKTVVPPTPPVTNPDPEPNPGKPEKPKNPENSGGTTKPTTPNNTTKVPETKTEKNLPEEKEEVEEATPPFGLNSLILKGVKENGEQEEIVLDPVFQMGIYEYTCKVSSEIQKIEIAKDAGIYNDCITIEQEETLKSGENIIKIKMNKEGQNQICYTIKVIKEEIKEALSIPETTNNTKDKKEFMISMPVLPFIILLLGIIIIEFILIKYVPWNKIIKR